MLRNMIFNKFFEFLAEVLNNCQARIVYKQNKWPILVLIALRFTFIYNMIGFLQQELHQNWHNLLIVLVVLSIWLDSIPDVVRDIWKGQE